MIRLGTRVTQFVADHLASLRHQPVYTTLTRTEAERLIAGPAPEQGRDFETLLETLHTRVFSHAAREPHPGFMAYVPSCPTFPAVLGDWLATGFNCFAGVWSDAAGPNALELTALDWFRSWLGMPKATSGLLTSGGSAATVTAIVAARHAAVGDQAGRLERLTMYTSSQAHSASGTSSQGSQFNDDATGEACDAGLSHQRLSAFVDQLGRVIVIQQVHLRLRCSARVLAGLK